MKKNVVVLYGAPGAGKGTQANLLAEKLGMTHFDTGKLLESIVHDPARQKEPLVKRERAIFDSGVLMTPSFVTGEVVKAVKRIAAAGGSIVFSGSPRTMYEAEREYPILEKLYGKKNVHIFMIDVPAAYSLKRNAARMVCSFCGFLLRGESMPKGRAMRCPVCGGPFYKRSLDNPEVIKVRLREYHERTIPILGYTKRHRYRVVHVDGRPAPYKVTERIMARIK